VGHRGTVIVRLKKRHVERLLADYDADPIAALTTALRITLNVPGATWATLLAEAPIEAERRRRLLSGDQRSLDHLAAELNEHRSIDENQSHTHG
jgi:hypothetical protein